MATFYLDVDDEITSAATRIRSATDDTIAIVLPPGSRVATSRINFRLLAREAQAHHRRLSIVAPEAATRALAASAGLPVFGTVSEYEAALTDRAHGAESGVGVETATALDELAATVAKAPAPGLSRTAVLERESARPATKATKREPKTGSSRTATPAPPRRRISFAAIALIALAVIVLAAGGIAAYLFVPSATIRITPRENQMTPLQLTVKVDPSVKTADTQALVAPGITQNFAVDAHGTFDATGTKVNKTAASGIVTFSSQDTGKTYYVAAQTQVWTSSGVVFLTQSAATIPRANFDTHTLGTVNVAVTAKNPGNSGNVAAGAITNLSPDFGDLVGVSNASATNGGTETTIHLIAQSDVDAAKLNLASQLNQQFNAKLTDPSQSSGTVKLFPDTSQLAAAAFDPDPATLVGKQVDAANPKFDLVATANGTATAADISAVRRLADARVRSAVPSGQTLVEDSLDIQIGPGVAQGTAVSVPVSATARTVQNIDVNAVKGAIKGKSPGEAKAYLAKFGKVELSLSPDWIPSLPGYDFRITVQVVTTASPSPSTSPTAPGGSATPAPSPSPTGAGAS